MLLIKVNTVQKQITVNIKSPKTCGYMEISERAEISKIFPFLECYIRKVSWSSYNLYYWVSIALHVPPLAGTVIFTVSLWSRSHHHILHRGEKRLICSWVAWQMNAVGILSSESWTEPQTNVLSTAARVWHSGLLLWVTWEMLWTILKTHLAPGISSSLGKNIKNPWFPAPGTLQRSSPGFESAQNLLQD